MSVKGRQDSIGCRATWHPYCEPRILMAVISDYGHIFRDAYAVLHGGRADEGGGITERKPGEPLEEYLARSRSEAVGRGRKQLLGAEPPQALAKAHDTLLQLLANAVEADAALAAQVLAYRCGQFHESVAHSDRLQPLVAESARLDRELIVSLREAEARAPGTLAELGLEGLPSSASGP